MDGTPSTLVFAMDVMPEGVGTPDTGTALLRRYLDSGGKVVWMGTLPEYVVRGADGGVISVDVTRPAALLGVDFSSYDGDIYGITPTDVGRRWGMEANWVGQSTTRPSEVSEVLAVNALGQAAAWVKNYGGPPGTGFIFVRAVIDGSILEEIQRIAEYGLSGVSVSR